MLPGQTREACGWSCLLLELLAEWSLVAGIKPRDIDFLVVNCSLFCPTPSLSAMIVNHFRMRSNIVSYNLGGALAALPAALLASGRSFATELAQTLDITTSTSWCLASRRSTDPVCDQAMMTLCLGKPRLSSLSHSLPLCLSTPSETQGAVQPTQEQQGTHLCKVQHVRRRHGLLCWHDCLWLGAAPAQA